MTVPDFLISELQEYMEKIYGLAEDDRIFPITDRAVQKKMRDRTGKLQLSQIRVHDLRHSHIAFLIEKGVQPLVIAQRVGHESVSTTMNIYGHLYPNKQKQIADMLNTEATGEAQNKVFDINQERSMRIAGGMW